MKLNGISKTSSNHATRVGGLFTVLGAALLVMLLNGCASVHSARDPDPCTYNPITGYPAVGGSSWGRI